MVLEFQVIVEVVAVGGTDVLLVPWLHSPVIVSFAGFSPLPPKCVTWRKTTRSDSRPLYYSNSLSFIQGLI